MELYLKMTENEFEEYKELKNHSQNKYSIGELTTMLLESIKRQNGIVNFQNGIPDPYNGGYCDLTTASIQNDNLSITLSVRRRG